MATSYNGWLAVRNGEGIDRSFTAAGAKFPAGVLAGDVATIFRWLIERLDTIEPVVPGWCWGYSYRANVNNPSTLSCHSSGTAIDYNAPNHPNGGPRYGGWSDSDVKAIRGWLAELDGVVCWGADFGGTKDPMHFEIQGSALKVATVAARLGGAMKPPPTPKPAPAPAPAPPTTTIDLEPEMPAVIRDAQTGHDYIVGAPFTFVHIESEDAYKWFLQAGLIDVPHGEAPKFNPDQVEWFRGKIVAWRAGAGLNANVDEVFPKA